VTGTRSESPELWLAVRDALRPFLDCHVVLIHGNATGADAIAKHCLEMAQRAGKKWDPCQLSYFSDLGKRGGMARNVPLVGFLRVLQLAGFGCRAFAFPDDQSVGTRGCMRLLTEAGFTVAVQEMGPRR
jgi:hypothetical protein